MKVFRIIGRSIRNACKSLIRNLSLTTASIACSLITLILVSLGMLVSYNVNSITNNIEEELTIVVFMDNDITNEEIKKMTSDLEKVENIKSVSFKSKNDIKKELADESDTFNKIISNWKDDENPLQDSYIIEVKNVKDINETATTIKNMDNVSLVKYGESTVNELIQIFDVVRTGTLFLVIGLILVTAFLINNTIKITIFSRKREIDIMRLVGTSNVVIKLPFLIEGFLIGLIGSIVPILVTIFGYTYAYNQLNNFSISNILNIIRLANPNEIVYTVSIMLALIGTVVGMLSSVRAVRKYLTI